MRASRYLLTFCAVAVSASFVFAGHVYEEYDFTSTAWQSSDFSLVGNSYWVDDTSSILSPTKRLRLTSSGTNQQGSAWMNSNQINASRSWAATYRWQFSYGDDFGADGLGFHVQTEGTNADVSCDYAETHEGWLSVNVDSYKNTESSETLDAALEVFYNGSWVGTFNIAFDNVSLMDHKYRNDLVYNADLHQLSITVTDETASQSTGATYSLDMSSVFNDETDAYVGFSANTGASYENHDLLYFAVDAVPEPATLALLAGGAVLIGLRRKRRK